MCSHYGHVQWFIYFQMIKLEGDKINIKSLNAPLFSRSQWINQSLFTLYTESLDYQHWPYSNIQLIGGNSFRIWCVRYANSAYYSQSQDPGPQHGNLKANLMWISWNCGSQKSALVYIFITWFILTFIPLTFALHQIRNLNEMKLKFEKK